MRARKLCTWRDENNPSIGCTRLAEVSPNGENFRCSQHFRQAWSGGGERKRRVPALTQAEKDFVRERDWHVCRICGEPAKEVDHIQEVADGGDNRPSNLQLLCDGHHKAKTVRSRMDNTVLSGKVSARAKANRRRRRMGI